MVQTPQPSPKPQNISVRRVFYHMPLCPFSRSLRLGFLEKRLSFTLQEERINHFSDEFFQLSPEGTFPVWVDGAFVVKSTNAIIEYIEESYPQTNFMGKTPQERAEVRRLIYWFHDKFFHEVTHHVLHEKVLKRSRSGGAPDSKKIKEAQTALRDHLDYISWLFAQRNWLGGAHLTWADFVAAGQLSVIDYLGDVPWRKHEKAKLWYARIKSRPSFRPLLLETFVGITPSHHYRMLDF
jgi:glutathione S-transferase